MSAFTPIFPSTSYLAFSHVIIDPALSIYCSPRIIHSLMIAVVESKRLVIVIPE